MFILILGIIAFLLVIALFLWPHISNAKLNIHNNNYEQDLKRRCFGDQSKVDRLINFELKKNPSLSRNDAARGAIQSIIRDNR